MSRLETSLPVADDDDAAANLVERRWFAASAAVKAMQGECAVLQDVLEISKDAWLHARAHLVELEVLRDALGTQLTELGRKQSQARQPLDRIEMSAA
jgi:hypothetical protein